jgi:K+-transporting ATPase A subunit
MLEIFLILAAALLLAWPLGLYLAKVMRGAAMRCSASSKSRSTRYWAWTPRAACPGAAMPAPSC